MPLINLKTDLRSLRYGNDRPGGGSSGQPYIQKSIPSPEKDPSNLFNTSGPDSLLRGGLLAPIKAATDVSRLSQMFFDFKSPSGPLFIAKQNLLSRTSVKTEASKGIGYGGGGVNQGVYLPTSTIAQAGAGIIGSHLNLLGINPFAPVSPDKGGTKSPLGLNSYFNIVKNQSPEDNRLVGLHDAISSKSTVSNFAFQRGVNLNTNKGTVLLEYGGGPGSILGIGKTKIKFADQRTGINNPLIITKPGYFYGNDQLTVSPSPELLSFRSRVGEQAISEDFRKEIIIQNKITDTSTILSLSPSYVGDKALDERVNQGSPGAANTVNGAKNVYNYGISSEALDKITALPAYESTGSISNLPINDLCQFSIATINNNKSDGSAVYMHFRAFINDFTDNYGANWNTVQYVGRGDSLANYGGFTRAISIGFTAAAQSKAELIPMYKKLNYLASSLAPDYSRAGFMRGNLVKITMGGYLHEQPGYLTSLTYSLPQESPWEIAIDANGNEDKSVKELPHMITVSLSFTPIHNFLPSKAGGRGQGTTKRYIALSNGANNNYDSVGTVTAGDAVIEEVNGEATGQGGVLTAEQIANLNAENN